MVQIVDQTPETGFSSKPIVVDAQKYPASISHKELQPSPSFVLPSSHSSDPSTKILSPHVTAQVLGLVALTTAHVYPHSTVQLSEHPSPDKLFPSSQKEGVNNSSPNTFPSPQTSFPVIHAHTPMLQVEFEHTNPASTIQSSAHPSKVNSFPSSHSSYPTRNPSPHVV